VHPRLTLTHPADAGATLDRALQHLQQLALPAGDAALRPILAALAAGAARRVRLPILDLDDLLLPAALASYVAWTGDLHTAAAAWPRIRSSFLNTLDQLPAAALRSDHPDQLSGQHDTADSDDDGGLAFTIAAAALVAVGRLATDLGDPHFASRLHTRSNNARAALPRRARSASALHLAVCLDLLPPDSYQTPPYGGEDAVDMVLDTAFLVLGVQPDATRHRLWLRPRLPAGWNGLEASEIQAGGDSVRLSVELLPGLLRLRVAQEAGAIPVTALVEPFVPGGVGGVRIDGGTASLAPRPVIGGTRVAVQLVLDRERAVEIDVAPGGP
jgi:hypothetical protein